MKPNRKFIGTYLNEHDLQTSETFIAWHARDVAVVVIIADPTEETVLLEERGIGCPDNIGKLCCPCGYLSWDETLREAGAREAYEETGLKINPDDLVFIGINDKPDSDKQNITIRFAYFTDTKSLLEKLHNKEINPDTASRGGESNEVTRLVILSLKDIEDTMTPDHFAFNHFEMIKNFFKDSIF